MEDRHEQVRHEGVTILAIRASGFCGLLGGFTFVPDSFPKFLGNLSHYARAREGRCCFR